MTDQNDQLCIVVVDDNDMSLGIARTLLAHHKLHSCKTAQEGWDLYVQHTPDIIFLDIDLQGTNGLDLLEKIIAFDNNAHVVMMTASRVKEDMIKAKDLGASGYLMKPFSKQRLEDSIRQAIKS